MTTAAALALVVVGCGESGGEAADAKVMPDVVEMQLDVALSDIERAGFEDEVEILGGGTFGVVDESNWTVCEQLPAAGEPLTGTPRVTVDRSCGEEAAESTTTVAESTTSAAPPPAPPVPEETLTATNSPELAAILGGSECSAAIGEFAAKHPGRTIEFDGSVITVAPHGSFDILVAPGDLGPASTVGPQFQFQNVGTAELGLTGDNVPDNLSPGVKLHVVAKVLEYDSGSCLFILELVSTSVR